MASPPLTNREYAYLAISGPGNHETVTDRLEIRPSASWNAGDPSPASGRARQRMQWRLDSGLDDTHALHEHMHALLSMIRHRADAFRELSLEYDLTLQCVGHYPPSGHGAHLDRDVVRQLAHLGLSVDLDFYYVDDGGPDD